MTDAYKAGLKVLYRIERKFGEGKQGHDWGCCHYLGTARFAVQSFLTNITLYLKRMVNLLTVVYFKERAYASE